MKHTHCTRWNATQVSIKDVLRIPPRQLWVDYIQLVQEEINGRYINKVIPEVGICVGLWELDSVGDPMLYPGDAWPNVKVEFKLVVFRPFKKEILVGWVTGSDETGVSGTHG